MSRRPVGTAALAAVCCGAGRCVLLALAAGASWTAIVDVNCAEEPFQYRRMFLPEEEISKLDEVCLPVKRSEFDQLLSTVRAKQVVPGLSLGARIAEAAYTARLVGSELVEGQAELAIVHSGQTPVLLPLEPCGLVIGEAVWSVAATAPLPDQSAPEGKPDEPRQPVAATTLPDTRPDAHDVKLDREAKVGLNDRNQWVAYVERSGTLQFPWSAKGGRGPLGEVRLELRLPACPVNHLVLEIPKGFRPVAEQGVTYPLPPRSVPSEFQAWGVDLGGVCATVLHVLPEGVDWQSQRLVLWRQSSTYRFSPQGVEVRVDVHFEVHHQPLSYVTLALDSPLELVEAEQGDNRLRWSPSTPTEKASRQFVLELAEPLTGKDHVISLRAVAPAQLGSRWRLPTISVTDAVWQAGQVTLEMPRPLVLEQLNLEGCCQESASPLPAPASGESVQLRCFQPRPGMHVGLQAQEGELSALVGTTIRLGSSSSSAQMVADMASAGDQRFSLELDLAAHWNIDAIEAEPASMLEDWTLTQSVPRARRLLIRLREPLRPDHPLHLVIHASGRGISSEGPTSSALLRLGTWTDVRVIRSLVSLGAEPPHQTRFAGDAELVRIDPAKLPATEAGLINSVPGGVVFVDRIDSIPWRVSLSSEAPNYAAELYVEAIVEDKAVQQSARIRCLPRASSLSRLLVHFSESSEDPLRWTFTGEPSLAIDARRLLPQEQASAEGETWQIVLPRPQDAPFELRAERLSRFGESFTIPLPSLPDAAMQLGRVTVRTPLALPVSIDDDKLQPVPAESPPAGQSSTTRGAFRYDPSQVGRLTVVRRSRSGLPPTVWAWSCQMISRAGREGRTVHTLNYQLENQGAAQLSLERPAQAKNWRVTIDEHELTGSADGNGHAPLLIPLPRGVRFPLLRIEYTTDTGPLGAFGVVSAYWPRTDISVLTRSWLVWLPPDFDRLPLTSDTASPTWQARLSGPLWPAAFRQPEHVLAAETTRPETETNGPAGAATAAGDPWFHETLRLGSDLAETGWSAHTVPVPCLAIGGQSADVESQLRVYRPGVMLALGWGAFFMAAGLTWTLTRQRVVWAAPGTALAGFIALACPGYWLPVGSGVFWGSCLALTLVLFRRPTPQPSNGQTPHLPAKPGVTACSHLTLWLVLGIGCLSASTGWAVQPAAEAAIPASNSAIHRVYVPVDEGNQALGEYLFVPRSFYDALHREAAAGGASLLKWMIRSAEYRVVFHGLEADEELAATELVARFELDILRPDTKILLPIAAEQAYLLPNRARLDGQPAAVAWAADGMGLSVAAQGEGKAVLELAFRPKIDRRESSAGFEIRIPRVARSLVRFDSSAAMPEVQVPTALGGLEFDARTGERLVKLGPTERLSVQWSLEPTAATSVSEVEVDQLLWLKIDPGAVVLDTRLAFRSFGKPLRQIRIQVDPRLRLLPPAADQAIAEYYTLPQKPATLILELKPPYRKECTVAASFLVRDATGLGKLVLPRLLPITDRTQRRWLAISIAPSLQCELSEELHGCERDRTDFVAAWPPPITPPDMLLELPLEANAGSLTTSLKRPQMKVAPQLELAIGSESAHLTWRADVNLTNGVLFQHRILMPKEVSLRSISVTEQGTARAAHWSRDEKGAITVLLDRSLAESHQLQLTGQLPLPKNRRLELPRLTLAGAELQAEQVRIYRHPEVQVNLAKQTGYTDVPDAPLGQYRQGWGRLVAAVAAPPKPTSSAAPQLTITPNHPRIQGRLVILLSRHEEAWRAVADYELQIEGGLLDALRLDIPEEWTAPFEVEPAAECECVAWPGQTRRFLVVRPPREVSGRYRVRVRGAIATAPGERVRAPDILPLDVEHIERYLVAPTRIQQRQIAWETSGLQSASLPDDYGQPHLPSYVSYQALGPRFQATIKDVKVESGSARIGFADLHVDCDLDGGWRGTATFDLEPAGLKACELELPPDQRLVQVTVAGLPTLVERLDERRWLVPLSHRQLPQTIGVIFAGQLQSTQERTLELPRIRDVPVQRSLCTLRGAWDVRFPDPAGEELSADWMQDLQRLESMAELMQSAASVFAESVPQDMTRWYAPWSARWAVVRGRLERWRADAGRLSSDVLNRLAELDRQHELLAAKLHATQPPSAVDPAAQPSTELAAFPAVASASRDHIVCHACSGFPAVLQLELPAEAVPRIDDRLVGVGMLLGLALISCLLLPPPSLGSGLLLRPPLIGPPLIGLLLGLAWWWYATPSLLGLIVVAISLLIWIGTPLFRLRSSVAGH